MTNKELFFDPNEVEVARLQSGMITTENLSRDFCVVSDKRLYHNGKTVTLGVGGGTAHSESVINLKDITKTGFLTAHIFAYLFLGLSFIIGAISMAAALEIEMEAPEDFLILGIGILGLIFTILFFKNPRKVFGVYFGGGSLFFQVKGRSVKELQAFQRALQLAMEKAKAEPVCQKEAPAAAEAAVSE